MAPSGGLPHRYDCKLFLQQLAHLTPELLIRNLPNRRAVWHFGECDYYCRGGSECEQRHVFDTYVRDCVSARIRHDVQERAITRYRRWNGQHAVPGASRGAPLRQSPLEIEVWGCEIAVETGIVLDGGLPLFLRSEVSLGVDLEMLRQGARSECKWAAAGQIFPTSPVAPRHSTLAQALWDQHTRVYNQDDEGDNVRGEGFQVDQIKAARQFLKTFYAEVAVDGEQVNFLIPHTNTLTNELVWSNFGIQTTRVVSLWRRIRDERLVAITSLKDLEVKRKTALRVLGVECDSD